MKYIIDNPFNNITYHGEESLTEKMNAHFKTMFANDNKRIEWLLRNRVIPPITGEITSGKIKWRGIKIENLNLGFELKRILLQRGKEIGVISETSFKINLE